MDAFKLWKEGWPRAHSLDGESGCPMDTLTGLGSPVSLKQEEAG